MNLDSNPETVESGENNLFNRCERIKIHIDNYLSRNPRLSLQSVEDKTGVPGSTLRRIVSLKGNPQPEAVIKIFQSLGFDQDLYKYMNDFHPGIAKIMAHKNSHNNEYKFVNEDERDYFVNEDYFLLINLVYTTNGTTEEEVSYELGRKGLEKLQELLEKGIVQKSNDARYTGKITNYKLSFADTKKRVELALRHYRLEEAGNTNNWISFQTESLNKEGLKALKTLQQKQFVERKEQIFSNPLYNGNLKVYSAAVSSTFLSFSELEELQ